MASTASHVSFLPPILTFCAAAVVAVPVFRLLGLSAVLGYLAAGVAIGPSGLSLVEDPQTIATVAELGVVLLLFIIGLELKLSHFRARLRAADGDDPLPWRSRLRHRVLTPGLFRHRRRRCAFGHRHRPADAGRAQRPADTLRPALLRDPPVPADTEGGRASQHRPARGGEGSARARSPPASRSRCGIHAVRPSPQSL